MRLKFWDGLSLHTPRHPALALQLPEEPPQVLARKCRVTAWEETERAGHLTSPMLGQADSCIFLAQVGKKAVGVGVKHNLPDATRQSHDAHDLSVATQASRKVGGM